MKVLIYRVLSFALPVGIAILILGYVISSRTPPQQADPGERSRSVRVVTIEPVSFVPSVVGYGSVEPVRTWDAVAEVPGRIVHVHPSLRVGAVLSTDTPIIQIAKADYELNVQEAESNLKAAKAELDELGVRKVNAELSLALEQRSLGIKQDDVTRQEDLLRRGVTSQSTVDAVQRDFLQQQVKVQEIENSLRLFPAQIETQRSQVSVAEARLATAKLDLERTSIRMPFRGRVASKEVETTQFVAAGTVMASAGDISAAEIQAQVPQDQFARFVSLAIPPDFLARFGEDREPGSSLGELGWTASVALASSRVDVRWPAQVRRTSDTIDATSRAVGVIVTVDKPYEGVRPGVRPPLVKGMFVRVTLQGKPQEGALVVPRGAVHDGRVFVANAEDRLEIRTVGVRAFQGADALISGGLEFGERVVISDLSPAIEGMLLETIDVADETGAGIVSPVTSE